MFVHSESEEWPLHFQMVGGGKPKEESYLIMRKLFEILISVPTEFYCRGWPTSSAKGQTVNI